MIRPIALLISAGLLAGCASTSQKTVYPEDAPTMREVHDQHFESMGQDDIDGVREALGQPVGQSPRGRAVKDGSQDLSGYTRTAQDEIETRFERVPNPTLVMYVYPHLAGRDSVPVPGYATSFPMYDGHHYALPGETH
ncbi:TIGR03751 family conjugal transfer lipoprotein [Thioalkalivibrio sp. ALE20]|uniref:TIGR03751 family conjugal transfer lipoprotein n=1 Tax=Thioalkalivibrio sp. ALE20 TaxID=545275 RepID=UPI0012EAD859|nr:TIGR03751 family conjugal transfer lipoprotein [Thioalkalivibrio sp. ALE20]